MSERGLGLLSLALLAPWAVGATFNVSTTADSGTGSLRAAITAASANPDEDIINVPDGEYLMEAGTYTVSGRVLLRGESSAETIINGDFQFRAFLLNAGASVEMSNLEIRHARSVGSFAWGGAIQNNGSLAMTLCRISSAECSAEGGALMNGLGAVNLANAIVDRCEFVGNIGRGGAAISNQGNLFMRNTYIHGNRGEQGGGLATGPAGGQAVLINCTISGNTVTGNGGGIVHYRNNAGNVLNMVNCTVSGNTSGNAGGGIVTGGGVPGVVVRLFNCTVADNSATNGGPGLYVFEAGTNLSNTIIAGNRHPTSPGAVEILGPIISRGYNLVGNAGTNPDFTGPRTGDILGTPTNPVDAHLGPLRFNGGRTPTHLILGASPAFDRGNPAGLKDHNGQDIPADQRGVPRVRGLHGDIGAVEIPVGTREDVIRYLLGITEAPRGLNANGDPAAAGSINLIDAADVVTFTN